MNIIVQTDEGFHCLNLSQVCSVFYCKKDDTCYVSTSDATEYEITKDTFDEISSWLAFHNADEYDRICNCKK